MTHEVSHVYLFSPSRGEAVEAVLWDAITNQQLADWEGEWLPELFEGLRRIKRAGVEYAHWPQSRHWDWRAKTQAIRQTLSKQGFSLVCEGVTQGLMSVDLMRYCRLPEQDRQHLVYIDFLETAPWNRRELLVDPPRYQGVGTLLIRAAIELSKEEEFQGRIGLHSLPQANGFYANTCGMADLGPDPNYQNLRYFEMTPEAAEAFCARGERP